LGDARRQPVGRRRPLGRVPRRAPPVRHDGDARPADRLRPSGQAGSRRDRARGLHKIADSVAFVRGEAFEDDPADPIAAVQAAFMLAEAPGA
jgi:hypothetical protein